MTRLGLSLFALAALAAPTFAQTLQPLAVGDVRTYHNASAFGATQQVRTEVQRNSGPWYRFDNFLNQQDQWVALYQNRLYLFDANVGRVVRLFDFNAQVGDSWQVDFSGQFGAGASMQLAATDETVAVGAGTFRDCYRFVFTPPPGVADAGWGSIWFAPDVGVVKWTQQSFAGPVVFELDTATIGGVQYPQPVPATGGVTVSLTMDHYEYTFSPLTPIANIYATAKLTVVNASGLPIDVTYNSGQTFDIQLIDSQGHTVWVWSANKAFIQILRQEQIQGTFEVSDSIPLPLQDEDYTVRMYLTAQGRAFEATAPIRVRSR